MILFLTLIYVALLALAVKLGVIRLTLFWKLSPLLWMSVLLVALFLPMQFWAPAGEALVLQNSVSVVPNVSGEVTEVLVEPNQAVKKGDPLFRIDAEPYAAALEEVEARLELALIERNNSEVLRRKNAVSQIQLDRDEATVRRLQASRRAAEYNLRETLVSSPIDGYVTNLALRPGTRVAAFPVAPVMALVEKGRYYLVAQVPQSYLRLIEPGAQAEVTFKILPGQVFPAEVNYVVQANAQGQIVPGGGLVTPRELLALPYSVLMRIEDEAVLQRLPAGALGSVAIYTGSGTPTHIIRRVMIRMDAFLNYVIPY